MSELYLKCKEAADFIASRIDAKDAVGIVLGSGLGDIAKRIENPQTVEYTDIPHFTKTTVPGHEGKLILGYINGVKVLCMKGRYHFYEGHDMKFITMPVRVMKLLGVRALIETNAAGGVNRTFKPGTLMLIDDFINFMGDNPLVGPNEDEFGVRFPDMTKALSDDMKLAAKRAAAELGIDLKTGVYMSFRGPSFETPAEVKFAEIADADAVGMSTVPDFIVARHCNLPICGISCITNMGAGITGEVLTVEEVQETSDRVKSAFADLICRMVTYI